MATFMEILDTSIANVSLPHIAGNLSVSQDESTWVLTSYLVSNAVVLPISGWISNRMGRKRFYMTCVALFTASSFLCGIAPSLGWLIFFRVLQGVGGGGLGPSEQAILADTFPPARRGMAMAVYGMAVVLAPAIGPTLGGFITDNFNWRWVFFINIPVGIVSLILSSRVVTDPPHLRVGQGKGALDERRLGGPRAHRDGPRLPRGRARQGARRGLVPLVLHHRLLHRGRRHARLVRRLGMAAPEPRRRPADVPAQELRDIQRPDAHARHRAVRLDGAPPAVPASADGLLGAAVGHGAVAGGLVVIALLPLVGVLVSKADARFLIMFGFSILSVSLFTMSRTIDMQMDFATAVELRAFQSVGMAFLFVPIQTLSYSGVPPQKYNQVSGIMNLSRNMGADIGIAFVTTLIGIRTQSHQARLAAHTTAYDPSYQARVASIARALEHAGSTSLQATQQATAAMYRQLVQQATQLAYLDALWLLGVACAVMVPLVLFTQRPQQRGAPAAH